jgi:4'-phosphopantetheinyl transferase
MVDPIAPLEPTEVRVYHAPSDCVADPERALRCLVMLSVDERERHLRFRFEPDRHSYLCAHALTRDVLSQLLGAAPDELRFELGPHGRPELCWPDRRPRLRFNLSHTRGLVACAFALERDVGVDVEQVNRSVAIEQLARSVFSAAERSELARLGEAQKRERFFQLWTLKEAYIKAVGTGLAAPLRSISVELGPEHPPRLRVEEPLVDDGASWTLDVRRIATAHMLALAVNAPRATLNVGELAPACAT